MKNSFFEKVITCMDEIATSQRNIGLLHNSLRTITASEHDAWDLDTEQETLTTHLMHLEAYHEAGKQLLKDLNAEIEHLDGKWDYYNRKANSHFKMYDHLKAFFGKDDKQVREHHEAWFCWLRKKSEIEEEQVELEAMLDQLPKLLDTMKAVIDRHTPASFAESDDLPDLPFVTAPIHAEPDDNTQTFRDLVANHAETLFNSAVDAMRCGEFHSGAALKYMRASIKPVQFLDVLESLDEVMDNAWAGFFNWLEDAVENTATFTTLRGLFVDTLSEVIG